MRARSMWGAALAILVVACAPPAGAASPPPTASASPVATTPATPTAALSATPTLTAAATPTATATSAPSPAPTTPGRAAYCNVADVPTSPAGYDDHARTPLDWTHALPETYSPPDLVSAIDGQPMRARGSAAPALSAADVLARRGDPAYATLLSDDPNSAIRGIVYGDLAALRAAASAAGRTLVIMSAYRSYGLQRLTFDYWVRVGGYQQALRTSARPGHSEHQLGTAVDFGDGSAAPWEYADWASTPSGAWLAQYAADYGFVMTLQRGSSDVTCYDYEPWHYRWVGKDLAKRLQRERLTLRELQARGMF